MGGDDGEGEVTAVSYDVAEEALASVEVSSISFWRPQSGTVRCSVVVWWCAQKVVWANDSRQEAGRTEALTTRPRHACESGL